MEIHANTDGQAEEKSGIVIICALRESDAAVIRRIAPGTRRKGRRMTEREIKIKIIEQAEEIAKELHKGKDIEIKTSNSGLKVLVVDRKVVK